MSFNNGSYDESSSEDVDITHSLKSTSHEFNNDSDHSHIFDNNENSHSHRLELDLIDLEDFSDSFIAPNLHTGRNLIIDILDSWGDEKFIGLTGIEIYNIKGHEIGRKSKISSLCKGIEIGSVNNLINCKNLSHDDKDMWLTTYTKNGHHLILMEFEEKETICLIRFWNYSKSRIHANRGAKSVVIYFDNQCIAQTQVRKICNEENSWENLDDYYEAILFTDDVELLNLISLNDSIFKEHFTKAEEEADISRPTTGEDNCIHKEAESIENFDVNDSLLDLVESSPQKLEEFSIFVHSNWNEKNGLNWIAFDAIQLIAVSGKMIRPFECFYRINGKIFDQTLIRMVNTNDRVDSTWFGSFKRDNTQEIVFIVPKSMQVGGIKIWNCNSSIDETCYGIKTITLKEKPLCPYLVRKGPGHHSFNYDQTILFHEKNTLASSCFGGSMMGFVYQFNMYTTWGDLYYIGLNGLELYDKNLKIIKRDSFRIFADPDSINMLPREFSSGDDPRVPENLVNGINNGPEVYTHCWLAPIIPDKMNKLFIVFDRPTIVSCIKIWNYSKTPTRGLKDFYVILDNRILMRCHLPKAKHVNSTKYHVVAFDKNRLQFPAFKDSIINCDSNEDVSEDEKSNKTKTRLKINQDLRPFTGCVKY